MLVTALRRGTLAARRSHARSYVPVHSRLVTIPGGGGSDRLTVPANGTERPSAATAVSSQVARSALQRAQRNEVLTNVTPGGGLPAKLEKPNVPEPVEVMLARTIRCPGCSYRMAP